MDAKRTKGRTPQGCHPGELSKINYPFAQGKLETLPADCTTELVQPLDLGYCFAAAPPPLDFVLPGLLSETVGAFVAPSGISKSTLVMQASTTVAGGPDTLRLAEIHGEKIPTGRVVYIAAEDPHQILHHRMFNLAAKLSPKDQELVRENLTIYPASGLLLDIIRDNKWRRWLHEIATGTRLVIIDTLRRVHALDENESGAMASLIGLMEGVCRKTGTTILFVHHTSKAGATTGEATSTRGSSVLCDNARLQLNMVTMTPQEAERCDIKDERIRKSFVRLIYSKTNYCPPFEDRWFRRRDDGILDPVILPVKLKKKPGLGKINRGGLRPEEVLDDDF